jgi:hypothetical protein
MDIPGGGVLSLGPYMHLPDVQINPVIGIARAAAPGFMAGPHRCRIRVRRRPACDSLAIIGAGIGCRVHRREESAQS